jgi:hypothetical protein
MSTRKRANNAKASCLRSASVSAEFKIQQNHSRQKAVPI